MFIIWGSTGREFEIGSGQFDCPACRGKRPYKHIRLARYFTLYFIPLFETDNLGQFVKCQECRQFFNEGVLLLQPQHAQLELQDEDLFERVREELEMGTSIQETKQLLLDMGTDGEVVIKLVAAAAGGRQKTCTRCKRGYVDTISQCAACGQPV